MGFNIDYKKTQSGGTIPAGTYEAVVKSAFEDVAKTGTVGISMPMIIRNDVEQPYRNAHVWHKLWKKKEPNADDLACGGYIATQINALSKAVGFENDKHFESLEEWMNSLTGLPLRITIIHDGEFNGKPNVRVDRVDVSKALPCKHVFPTVAASAPEGFVNILPGELDDEDLPF